MLSLPAPWTQCLDAEINTGLATFWGGGGASNMEVLPSLRQLLGKEEPLAEPALTLCLSQLLGSSPVPLPPPAGPEIQARCPVKGQHCCVGSFMETARNPQHEPRGGPSPLYVHWGAWPFGMKETGARGDRGSHAGTNELSCPAP